MLKNKLYQYFIKEFAKNFFLVLLSISLLMILTQAVKFLSIVTELGNPYITYFKYIILSFIKVIEKTIQLSFLISVFFTISKLKNKNELNIFWYSGVRRIKVVNLIFLITFFVYLFNSFLSIYISPYTSSLSRTVLSNSEFSLVNSLVKEKNFNSPLKELTIYVDNNDKNGNLQNVFIYERERTIVAQTATVKKVGQSIFLELKNGISKEKKVGNKNFTKFEKMIIDFSKFKSRNLTVPKFSERDTKWLFNNLSTIESKKEDLRYEINKRLIKPLFIFILALTSVFIIYSNEIDKKKNSKNFQFFIISFLLLILNEIFISLSAKNLATSLLYFFSILITSYLLYLKHQRYEMDISLK